jgi:transposase, IS5 family
VETHVHYPTDINLLWDALRKVVTLIADLSQASGLTLWRQSQYNLRQLKKLYRRAQALKHSTSKDEGKREAQQQAVIQAHQDYVQRAQELLDKAVMTLSLITLSSPMTVVKIQEIERFVAHAKRQISQIERRVVRGEKIPHEEKVFSLFQPHTEWISKGKAGVPVELGLRVCVLEDHLGFILHHHVMERQTDDQVAVDMVHKAQERFPDLRACSFDKGFHSPANQMALRECLELSVLPKKGRLNQADKARETAEEFQAARRQHSAVESAINALEVHGLDVCRDHGIKGFKRYVAMAVLARNIQKLGAELLKQEQAVEQRKRAA